MITMYSLDQCSTWDQCVCSFTNYDVYYLSGYVRAFQLHGDGTPILFHYEKGNSKAINVVIKRDIADADYFKNEEGNRLFDIVTPYGYGGWLTEGEVDINSLKSEYEECCRNQGIISEFVRFSPVLENWKGVENLYDEIIYLGNTVFMDTSSSETVWQNLTSKNRNVIRKAQKSGLEVYWGRDPQIIDPFIEIYNATMEKDNADKYYYFDRPFYESILEDLKQNAMWFYVKSENEIAAIAIFMFCNGKMHYHLSAFRKEYQKLAPTNLLLYEAAVWAANHGYSKLHMGGGVGSSQDSLYKFKKAFNREKDLEFNIGKKIFIPDEYERLVEVRKENPENFDVESSFFPLYRAVI